MGEGKIYTCGTLRYTLPRLIMVFVWLMLGGVVYSVCLGLPGSMIPVQLRILGTTETEKMIILGTIGGLLNMTVCPYIGFVSDRHRGKWGRRIPYILSSLPFLVLALCLFAFTGRIGAWLGALAEWNPATVTVILIAMVMFLFQFFMMFVGSVIWYIFNDVIPAEFFGRVMGAFQIATTGGSALYNLFVFKYTEKYFCEIFIAGALLYGVGMLAMCLMVREGEYPPVAEEDPGRVSAHWKKWFGGLRTFLSESFSHRFYLLRYAVTMSWALTWVAGIYTYNFQCELGLNEEAIGRLNGFSLIVGTGGTMVVVALVSGLVNRWHPMRITAYNIIFAGVTFIAGAKWVFGLLPPDDFIYCSIACAAAGLVLNALAGVSGLPMEMLTFPKSRFGSFCSMQALLRSVTGTVFGLLTARLFDFLNSCFKDSDTFHFRFVTICPILWGFVAAGFCYLMYREWGRLGGYRAYACPASWSPDGREAMKQPEACDPSSKWLKRTLYAYDFLQSFGLLSALGAGISALRRGNDVLAWRFWLIAGIPMAAALGCWLLVRHSIQRDLKCCREGRAPRNGIPHHGMLFLVWCVNMGYMLISVYQTSVRFDLTGVMYLMLQGIANLVLAGLIYAVCRMERGIVTRVAEYPREET